MAARKSTSQTGRRSDIEGRDSPILRLAGMLRARKAKAKSYQSLAREINDANGSPKTMVIDRRKLAKIAEGTQDVSLSVRELIALDRYFERFNQSLAKIPILEKPSILETLTEGGHIAFLLGARPHENRVDMSNWDVEGLAEIMRDSGGVRRVRFDIKAILLEMSEAAARNSGRAEPSRWRELLGPRGPSLVCLGSPRSCHASEVMLARMFGKRPFESAYGQPGTLPFYFVWGPDQEERTPSRFGFTPEEFSALGNPAAARVKSNAGYVLLAGRETYVADRTRPTSYGVIVAQRRSRGQVWVVIAGLTGAATHAAARCVKDIHTNLPPLEKHDQQSGIVWAVVEATTEREESGTNPKIRRVIDQEIIGGVRRFPESGANP